MKKIVRLSLFLALGTHFISIHGMLNLSSKRLKDFRLLKPLSQQRLVQTQKPQTLTLSPVWLQDTFSGLKPIAKHYWNELSVFSYKNVWSNYFAFNPKSATKLLEKTWETNPQLAENLGLFIFQRMAKEKYITYEMGQCLAEIINIFVLNGNHVPDELLQFIILYDHDVFSHFYNIWDRMTYDLGNEKNNKLWKVNFSKLLVSILNILKTTKRHYEEKQVELLFDLLDSGMTKEILKNLDSYPSLKKWVIIDKNPGFEELLLSLEKDHDTNDNYKIPSYHHLKTYGYESYLLPSSIWKSSVVPSFNFFPIVHNVHFIHMIQHIISKEKELIDAGYEVFYHGRRWRYGFLSDVYGMLYSYKSGKELNDFIFTQMDDPILGKVSEKFYAAETAKRERLLLEGNPFSRQTQTHPLGFVNRQSLLFLNKFLFGNLHRLGSNSMHYVLDNKNMGDIVFSVEEIFKMFGCYDAYQEFEKELNDLQQEHNNLSKYGEMLQIAVPKKNIDKCIYYTTSGGPKKEFYIPETGEITTDINVILKYLDKNPDDITEFVLVETRDKFGGLNPESGIKVFSYNAVDPEAWQQFKEKEKTLFERIQEWMRQKERRMELEQRARE